MPDLDFTVESAEVLPYAAVPTILFRLGIQNAVEGEEVNSISLKTQIRISSTQRHYNDEEQSKLRELFGEPRQWKGTLRSVPWTNTIIPRFSVGTVFEMPMTCTYDFEEESDAAIDTHGMHPVKVIRFARALGAKPVRTLVVGCEPRVILTGENYDDMLMELSEPVQAAVGEAVKLVESVVEEICEERRKAGSRGPCQGKGDAQ